VGRFERPVRTLLVVDHEAKPVDGYECILASCDDCMSSDKSIFKFNCSQFTASLLGGLSLELGYLKVFWTFKGSALPLHSSTILWELLLLHLVYVEDVIVYQNPIEFMG
jgi:hypothetical protein